MGSIKISKLGCKIMSGLTACIIGLSPCIGTQVSAIWVPSAGQNIDIENCTKKQLLEVVPDLWRRFWATYDDADVWDDAEAAWILARAFAYNAANAAMNAANVVYDDAYADAIDPANVVYDDARAAARAVARAAADVAFVNAWRRGGAAYKIVKDKDRAYFENLVRVLEEQIAILEDIVNQNRH